MADAQSTPDLFDEPGAAGEYEYDDAGEFHTIERLREIHDSRKRFDRARHEAYHAAEMGRISDERARMHTAQLALDFIRHLEPLVRRTDADLLARRVTLSYEGGAVTATVGHLLDNSGAVTITTTEEFRDPETMAEGTRQVQQQITLDRAAATRLVRLGDDFLEDIIPSGLTEQSDDTWEI